MLGKKDKIDFKHNLYEAEAREKWGDQAVETAQAAVNKISEKYPGKLEADFKEIFTSLGSIRHLPVDSKEAQEGMKTWYAYLNQLGHYSPEAFRGLGQMYVDDSRFTQNIDQYGQGLAQFMKEAMAIFADNIHAKE